MKKARGGPFKLRSTKRYSEWFTWQGEPVRFMFNKGVRRSDMKRCNLCKAPISGGTVMYGAIKGIFCPVCASYLDLPYKPLLEGESQWSQ